MHPLSSRFIHGLIFVILPVVVSLHVVVLTVLLASPSMPAKIGLAVPRDFGALSVVPSIVIFSLLYVVYIFRFARNVDGGREGFLVQRPFRQTETVLYREVVDLVAQQGCVRVRYGSMQRRRSFWFVPDGAGKTAMVRLMAQATNTMPPIVGKL